LFSYLSLKSTQEHAKTCGKTNRNSRSFHPRWSRLFDKSKVESLSFGMRGSTHTRTHHPTTTRPEEPPNTNRSPMKVSKLYLFANLKQKSFAIKDRQTFLSQCRKGGGFPDKGNTTQIETSKSANPETPTSLTFAPLIFHRSKNWRAPILREHLCRSAQPASTFWEKSKPPQKGTKFANPLSPPRRLGTQTNPSKNRRAPILREQLCKSAQPASTFWETHKHRPKNPKPTY
jgi:hypothetical protein